MEVTESGISMLRNEVQLLNADIEMLFALAESLTVFNSVQPVNVPDSSRLSGNSMDVSGQPANAEPIEMTVSGIVTSVISVSLKE